MLGARVGSREGALEGCSLGTTVGAIEGARVGAVDGATVGALEGARVGSRDGAFVGAVVGELLGGRDGVWGETKQDTSRSEIRRAASRASCYPHPWQAEAPGIPHSGLLTLVGVVGSLVGILVGAWTRDVPSGDSARPDDLSIHSPSSSPQRWYRSDSPCKWKGKSILVKSVSWSGWQLREP
jgi:hypothetical protein